LYSEILHADEGVADRYAIGDLAVTGANELICPVYWVNGSNTPTIHVEGDLSTEALALTLLQNITLEAPTDTNPGAARQYPEFRQRRDWHNVPVPTASIADGAIQYAADQAAGNSCPHFRTEDGSVIRLYSESNIANADGTLLDITTKFNTLLSQLEAQGLLTP
jgi:hypothetical protein